MDHTLYRPEDFACDESYLRYYFKLEPKDIAYWEHWIRTHPEKLDVVISADQLIGFLSLQLPEEEFQHEYDRFTRAIAKAALLENTRATIRKPAPLPDTGPAGRSRRRAGMWLILLSMVLVAGSAWLFESRRESPPASAALQGNTVSRKNSGNTVLDIVLEEGSLVRLQPGAELAWPTPFDAGKRELSLVGSAAFSIGKNPRRPFYVYCNGLVVHVLGTGFAVETGRHGNTVTVSVSSGKVEVYEKKTATGGVVLAPNQKLVYTAAGHRFETGLADQPQPLDAQPVPAVFDSARAYEVIRWLEKHYGIDIDVENETLYNCRFSGSLPGTGFYDAMERLCRPLHTSYEVKGTRVIVRGAGCDSL